MLLGSLAASAAMVGMLVGSATVASASASVELQGTGTIVSKGLAVVVPVEVTCDPSTLPPFPFPPFPPSGPTTVTVQLSQRSGNRITQAFGSASVVCDSTPHTVEVRLLAQQSPFKQGAALATASVSVCDTISCHQVTDVEEISLKK